MQTMELPGKTLGRLQGKVIKGRQIARTLGFPTANLQLETFPEAYRMGVYGVTATHREKQFKGIMNLGVRPTFQDLESAVQCEVHLFDFNQTLYGDRLDVEVCFFVRDEMKFSGVNSLKRQIEKDVSNVRKRFCLMDSPEKELHLTDFAFFKLCEDVYGVNRGVYNTIDSLFFDRGVTQITERRKTILSFLEYLTSQTGVKRTSHIKFGSGGLTAKLQEFCQFHLGGL